MMWALENRDDDKYDHGDNCEVDDDMIIATTMLISMTVTVTAMMAHE